jgi:L-ribulokinase
MTLATRAPEVYRALVEATAFGTRVIVDAFERAGVAVGGIVACGGLPERNPLLTQVYADVCSREITVAGSRQAAALGAAMFGAVAAGGSAGGHDSIADASAAMAAPVRIVHAPDSRDADAYEALYAEYVRLHDIFGRGGDSVMRRLGAIQAAARQVATLR